MQSSSAEDWKSSSSTEPRDPETNVTNDDLTLTSKIAWAHLKEFPDYYSRLDAMEAEADAYWASRR